MKRELFQLRLSKLYLQDYQNKILHIFEEVDMRKGHPGLAQLTAKQGISVSTLGRGEYVIFVNRDKSGVKVFTSGHTICYQKSEDGSPFSMNTIMSIPYLFNGPALLQPRQAKIA